MGKVDPNEAPEGYLAVDDSDGVKGCVPCSFTLYSKACISFPCSALLRKDGCYVFFVKKHEDGRATASWPYDSEGTPVEVPHA